MKKIMTMVLCLLLVAGLMAGCHSKGKPEDDDQKKTNKLKIVTTIFPEFDWVHEILGEKADNAEVTMLLDKGVDLHSYQPTADDIVKISDCDLFVYVGGESDGWVEDALKNATNKKMKVINLIDVLGESVKTEESVEGMQEGDHNHGHGHGHGHHHGHDEITEEKIKDRSLSDFAGAWKSLHPYLMKGDLEPFCQHKAEKDGDETTTKDTYFEKYKASWASDADKVLIEGNKITFTYKDGKTASADYQYDGFSIKTNSEGKISGVRYQFKTDSTEAPTYVQFNDHGHEPSKPEHFHLYFGNESFDALMESKTNSFFVKEALSVEEILEELMGHGHEDEKDEHVWLSLKNAKVLCAAIGNKLGEIDPANKDIYEKNVKDYLEKLSALDEKYGKTVGAAARKTVLFGDRFPFRYLLDDYGLKYYAAFMGCSAETEASFETISFLSKKMDELKLPAVLTIEGAKHKIAETIVSNTAEKNQKILSMDSMQSTTLDDVKKGVTYLSVMEKNLSMLKEALD